MESKEEDVGVDNPFADALIMRNSGWIIGPNKEQYDKIFHSLSPIDGKISGEAAKGIMTRSGLSFEILGSIWRLSDLDRDGKLDADEFAVSMHLINSCLRGEKLPTELGIEVVPPSKRQLLGFNPIQDAQISPTNAQEISPTNAQTELGVAASSDTGYVHDGFPYSAFTGSEYSRF